MVRRGDSAPPGWSDAPRISLTFSNQNLVELRSARLASKSIVIEIPDGFSNYLPEIDVRNPHEVGANHSFLKDDLAPCYFKQHRPQRPVKAEMATCRGGT